MSLTTTTTSTVTPSDIAQDGPKILATFNNLVAQLLDAVEQVFPDDEKTKMFQMKYNIAVKNNEENQKLLIESWHSTLSPFYERCKQKDTTVIEADIPIFSEIGLAEKFNDPEFDDEDKDALWEYINHLNNYAQLYCQVLNVYSNLTSSIPPSILGRIDTYAKSVAEQMQNGQLDLSKIDIQKLNTEVLGNVSEEDLEQMMNSLPDIAQNLSSVLPAMQSGAAGNPQLASLLNNDNISALMAQLAGGQGPPARRR